MKKINTREDILFFSSVWQKSKVLFTAVELDIFSHLSDFVSYEDLSKKADLSARYAYRLLNALASMGLLEKKENLFKNTPVAERYLNPESPDYLKNLRHGAHVFYYWNFLPRVIKEGASVFNIPEIPKLENWLEDFISAMDYYSYEKAPFLSDLIELNRGDKILDLGGGSGAFASKVAEKNPECSVYIFDLPEVIDLAKKHVSEKGNFTNINFIGGDYLKDSLGGKYNVIFLSNILHMHGEEEIKLILKKCFDSLSENGKLYIHDYFLDEEESSPERAVFFAINMLVHTNEGDCLTFNQMRKLAKECGFSDFHFFETPFQSYVFKAKK